MMRSMYQSMVSIKKYDAWRSAGAAQRKTP
jgi:hypothetical protein